MELINCQGKTPDATMASALYTDVKRKLHTSVFTRPQVLLAFAPSMYSKLTRLQGLPALV